MTLYIPTIYDISTHTKDGIVSIDIRTQEGTVTVQMKVEDAQFLKQELRV